MPTFRIGTLMIAVAVAAVAFKGGVEATRLYRLSASHRQLAIKYTDFETGLLRSSEERRARLPRLIARAKTPEDRRILSIHTMLIKETRKHAQEYGALKLKYERAARYPWLAVEPDPPEPK